MIEELRKIMEKEFNPMSSAFGDSIAMKLADELQCFYDEDFVNQASKELKDIRDNVSKEFIDAYNSHSSLSELRYKVSSIWKQADKENIDF